MEKPDTVVDGAVHLPPRADGSLRSSAVSVSHVLLSTAPASLSALPAAKSGSSPTRLFSLGGGGGGPATS